MNRRPTNLPHIEDATLRACLDSVGGGRQDGGPSPARDAMAASTRRGPPDSAAPVAPVSLATWRRQADSDYALLHMVAQFMAKTDAALRDAGAEFPDQVAAMRRRLGALEVRLADQLAAVSLLLDRLDATTQPEGDDPA